MPFFNKSGVNVTCIGWWILVSFKGIFVLAISSFRKMLSFERSHLNKRCSLLANIIISEGVIGVTKIIGKTWPMNGFPNTGVIIKVLSIIILGLRFSWFPKTIRSDCGAVYIATDIIPTMLHISTLERSNNSGGH